jgi:hypothetical protein
MARLFSSAAGAELARAAALASIGMLLGGPIATASTRTRGFGELPLAFEANRGQMDSRAEFLSRGPGYSLFLGPTAATLALRRPDGHAAVLRMQLVGANATAVGRGEGDLPGRAHYFKGSDPTRWTTDVRTYARVRYAEVYAGVDLVYYGSQRQLEYDFVVGPGSDPAAIGLRFEGAARVEVQDGILAVEATAGGVVRLHPPVAYQTVEGARKDVASRYVLRTGTAGGDPSKPSFATVGIDVAEYDRSRALVIDPILSYSTFLGGSSFDSGHGIAVDGAGSAYVTGETASPDFPTAAGTTAPSGGSSDVFVAKLSPDGRTLLYSAYLGGSGEDNGWAIAVDAAGRAYVTGRTFSSDFPTRNALQPSNAGGFGDAFVAALDPAGSLVYSTYLGGAGDDDGRAIAVSANGTAYLTGSTTSGDFPTANALVPASPTGGAYVTAVAPSGALVYSTFLSPGGGALGQGIAVDRFGAVYVAGLVAVDGFPTVSAVQTTLLGVSDAFVLKLAPGASSIVYSTYLGGGTGTFVGPAGTDANGLAIDAAGNAYVTGLTSARDFPTVAALQPVLNGAWDSFVTKVAPNGGALVFSTFLGGGLGDAAHGIAVDTDGNAYVAGETSSPDFPTKNAVQPAMHAIDSAFVTKITPAGALAYSSFLGGTFSDIAYAVAADVAGNPYLTGVAQSEDFPTVNALQPTSTPGGDAFVTKVDLHAPSAVAGPDQTVAEDKLVTLDGSGSSDPKDRPLTYAWTQTSGPTVTLALSDPVHPTFVAPNVPNAAGSGEALTFELVVSNGAKRSVSDPVKITVTPVNDSPTAADDAYQGAEDTTLTIGPLGVLDNDSDIDGDGLAAVLVSPPAHGTLTLLAHGGFTYRPNPNFNGQDGFDYAASDGQTQSAPAHVSIVVTPVNDAPHADAGPDETVSCGQTARLDGSRSSDPDGDTLAYVWTGDFGTATGPRPVVTLGTGIHTVVLNVSDGHGGASTDTVTIAVADTTPPVFRSLRADPDVLSGFGHAFADVTVTADAGDACTAVAACAIVKIKSNEPVSGLGADDKSPDWRITGPLTASLRGERDPEGAGRVYTLTVECRDVAGNASSKTVEVDVSPPGRMKGSGRVLSGDRRYDFTFDVREDDRGVDSGKLGLRVRTYNDDDDDDGDRDREDRFEATTIDAVELSDSAKIEPGHPQTKFDTATVRGRGRWNGQDGYTFEAAATDAGEPGKEHDRFAITIRRPGGTVVARVDKKLEKGNNQALRR